MQQCYVEQKSGSNVQLLSLFTLWMFSLYLNIFFLLISDCLTDWDVLSTVYYTWYPDLNCWLSYPNKKINYFSGWQMEEEILFTLNFGSTRIPQFIFHL